MSGAPVAERRSIRNLWEDLAERTLTNIKPDSIQFRESRRFFYAGALAWAVLMFEGLDDDAEPTDLDMAYLDSLHDEIKAFGEAVQAGKA